MAVQSLRCTDHLYFALQKTPTPSLRLAARCRAALNDIVRCFIFAYAFNEVPTCTGWEATTNHDMVTMCFDQQGSKTLVAGFST